MAIANRFVAMYLANRHRQERVFRERAAHMAMGEEEFRANFRLSGARSHWRVLGIPIREKDPSLSRIIAVKRGEYASNWY